MAAGRPRPRPGRRRRAAGHGMDAVAGRYPGRRRTTPLPNVFAAGDATGVAHWEAASRQGTAAARAMLGLPPRAEQPPLVWSDQHGVRIQRIGDPRGAEPLGDLTYARDGRHRRRRAHERPGRAARGPPPHRHPDKGGRMTLTVQIDDGPASRTATASTPRPASSRSPATSPRWSARHRRPTTRRRACLPRGRDHPLRRRDRRGSRSRRPRAG